MIVVVSDYEVDNEGLRLTGGVVLIHPGSEQ